MPKPSDRLARATKERGAVVTARLKEITKSKRKESRGRGYSREDLETLRDGRS
jgi:hypothetical protein